LQIDHAPSPAGEDWGEENKITSYVPLIPAYSLNRKGVGTCVDTYALREGVEVRESKSQVISYAFLSSICFTRLS